VSYRIRIVSGICASYGGSIMASWCYSSMVARLSDQNNWTSVVWLNFTSAPNRFQVTVVNKTVSIWIVVSTRQLVKPIKISKLGEFASLIYKKVHLMHFKMIIVSSQIKRYDI